MGKVLLSTLYFCLTSILALISLKKFLKYLTIFSSVLYIPLFNILKILNFTIIIYILLLPESTDLSMTGITPHLTSSARPHISVLYLKFNKHVNLTEIWHISEFHIPKILCGLGFFTLLFSLFVYLNSKLYISKCKNRGKRVNKNNIFSICSTFGYHI